MVVQHRELLIRGHHVHNLLDGLCRHLFNFGLHTDRLFHPLRGQLHHILGKRRAVEHRAAFFLGGQLTDNRAHIRNKAHVEHAVSLVNNQCVHHGEINHA